MSELNQLTDRQRRILFFVVDDFIHRGEAVASAAIARSDAVQVSPATVRNVMGDLEEAGFLHQPHTSSGRVPTPRAMREYVNFLSASPRDLRDFDASRLTLSDAEKTDEVAQQAGEVLSQLSHMAGLVLGPHLDALRLRDIRLVALTEHKVLAVLVTADRQVVERVCELSQPVDAVLLEGIQNLLSESVAGKTVTEVRDTFRARLADAQSAYRMFVERAAEISEQLRADEKKELHVAGLLNFLEFDDLTGDVDRLRALMRAVEERERLVEILDGVSDTRSPIAVIGPEMGESLGADLSLVVCGFYRGEDPVGLVGVLGPIRMDYARMIPLVDRVARVLSQEVDGKAFKTP